MRDPCALAVIPNRTHAAGQDPRGGPDARRMICALNWLNAGCWLTLSGTSFVPLAMWHRIYYLEDGDNDTKLRSSNEAAISRPEELVSIQSRKT
jgi:hypothetical protein